MTRIVCRENYHLGKMEDRKYRFYFPDGSEREYQEEESLEDVAEIFKGEEMLNVISSATQSSSILFRSGLASKNPACRLTVERALTQSEIEKLAIELSKQ